MGNKPIMIACCMLAGLLLLLLTACGESRAPAETGTESPEGRSLPAETEPPTGGTPTEPDPQETEGPADTEPNLDKRIQREKFENPDRADRPMVQLHSPSRRQIDDVYNRGYGGVVMNVAWSNRYLNNEREWATFADCVGHAAWLDLHVWIYDEFGYPSGCARGQTLQGNPEYEALGLVPVFTVVKPGETGRIDLLHGHQAIVCAYAYNGKTERRFNLSSAEDASAGIAPDGGSVTYTNRADCTKVLAAYMSKRWYENTHAMENWYAQQRAINMLDPEPTAKFLRITHDRYYEHVGKHFGNDILAFFTDEPAMPGSYFSISEMRNRAVLDQPDPDIPILECLNYSNRLFSVFQDRYGYDLRPLLGYLFRDDQSVAAKQVRIDFYQLTGDLFRENYLQQTADWCAEHGVRSSGHLLLEEDPYQHTWFSGNMIQLMGTMGIPGTDQLHSTGAGALRDACITSKLASSAADFLGKPDTFAEISGAFDGTIGDVYGQINAVGAQVACGINTFSSYYYQGQAHTLEEDRIFSAALGRMRYMVTGSSHAAKVLVYYPYEGVSAETLPSLLLTQPARSAQRVSDSFTELCRSLTSKQVDYTLADSANLCRCTVERGALVSPYGERYEAVVLPYTTALRSDAVLKLIEAADAGVTILLRDFDHVVCETGRNDVAARFPEVAAKAQSFRSVEKLGDYLRDNGYAPAVLDDRRATGICVTRRQNRNYILYTVVNTEPSIRTLRFTLEGVGRNVSYYNPVEGTVTPIGDASFKDDKTTFSFDLPADRTGFFVIER